MKIKTVLVDKDEHVRIDLKDLLQFYNIFDVVAEFDDVNAANAYLLSAEVDAAFINMAAGDYRYSSDGHYLAYSLSESRPDMIITLYAKEDHPASMIFSSNCAEFYNLPPEPATMQRVINRIKYRYELLQYKRQSQSRSVMIKTNQGYQLIPLDNILFIERYNRKNRMITTDGRQIILSGYSLDELSNILSADNFYRCYQSFIVNLAKVSNIRADNTSKNYALQFTDYAGEVMLSRDKYSEIVELLKQKYARVTL